MNKRIIKYTCSIFCVIIYGILIIRLCSSIGIDSDKANHLLQAKDILNGNFFLKDWNLTGVTFFTTDLLYYEIAVAVLGVCYRAIGLAGGMMIASAMIMAGHLCFKISDTYRSKIYKILLFILLLSIPCQYFIVQGRVHTGALFLSLTIYYLIDRICEDNRTSNKKIIILFWVLSCMGMVGDMLFAIECIMPVMLVCLYRIFIQNVSSKKYIFIVCASTLAIVAGRIWEKICFFIGGANRNSYIENLSFTPVTEWTEKLELFLENLFKLAMADFAGHRIGDVWNLLKILNFLFLMIAFFFLIRILGICISKRFESVDDCSFVMCMGILLSFFAFFFTDMAQSRYITLIPICSFVLVIRNFEWITDLVADKYAFMIKVIFVCVAVLCFLTKHMKFSIIDQYMSLINRNILLVL